MFKINVRIIVQGEYEEGELFAESIEKYILCELDKSFKKGEKLLFDKFKLSLTSDLNGRQTANFQFITKIK